MRTTPHAWTPAPPPLFIPQPAGVRKRGLGLPAPLRARRRDPIVPRAAEPVPARPDRRYVRSRSNLQEDEA